MKKKERSRNGQTQCAESYLNSDFPMACGENTPASKTKTGKPIDIVVTGIPRSGTSFLCKCLHAVENVVAINEPEEVVAAFKAGKEPWEMVSLYRNLRHAILNRQPVKNKLLRGEVVEDTQIVNQRIDYIPSVTGPNFVLATKNTLVYLSRIENLMAVMPHALFLCCVRHPMDVIASWKSTFPHLKNAAVDKFPVGAMGDPWIGENQRLALEAVHHASHVSEKRALLWVCLSQLILNVNDHVQIIKYEDLVANPKDHIMRILGRCQIVNNHTLQPSRPRVDRRKYLDNRDRAAITALCAKEAEALGFEL